MAKRKGTDWVVNAGSWTQGVFEPASGFNGWQMASPDPVAGPTPVVLAELTLPPASQSGGSIQGSALYQQDVTAVRVKGDILWRWTVGDEVDPILATNIWMAMDFRIMRYTADQFANITLSSQYDLSEAAMADESFLWHHTEQLMLLRDIDWWQLGILERSPPQGRIPVDIRVQRRLEPNDVLVLTGQLSYVIAETPPFDTLATTVLGFNRLRVLLRETG